MADVVIVKDGKVEYLKSVNTGEYVQNPNASKDHLTPLEGVLINPDISAVEGTEPRYWKVEGSSVVPMNEEEKVTVDAINKSKGDDYSALGEVITRDLAIALIKKGIITKEDLNG